MFQHQSGQTHCTSETLQRVWIDTAAQAVGRTTGSQCSATKAQVTPGLRPGVQVTPRTTPDAMAGVPVPARNVELMLVRLQVEQQQQLGAAVAAAVLLRQRHQRIERSRRQCWVLPWIERRSFYGSYANLMRELERESQGDFTNYMRMEPRMFHELLLRLTPRLTKMDAHYRRALQPGLSWSSHYGTWRPRVRPIVRWPTTSQKTDRSMWPLLEIVANIADRSHFCQIATNRTIRCDSGFKHADISRVMTFLINFAEDHVLDVPW